MKRNESPIFDSMNQCHAMTGIPVVELRRAKRGGCKAFSFHRVELFILLRWLYADGLKKSAHVVDVAAAKEADLIASAKLKSQKWAEKDGDLVPLDYFKRLQRDFCLPIRQRLFALPFEVAHLANPADPPHARKALQDWLEMNLLIMQAGIDETASNLDKKEKA